MKFTVEELIEATNGKLVYQKSLMGKYGISTDTRTIKSEEVYLPIKGETFDGHKFIDNAVDLLCRGYFINSEYADKPLNKDCHFIILVDDTTQAYLRLANYCRKKINPIVVGVTGSSGKTTTKEMIYSVLSQKYNTQKSKLNHNNEIGLCQTLLSLNKETEFVVVEMGMRGLGEIELLSKYAIPDIAIITNIGTSHIGRLGSIENIAKAKAEIVSNLNKEGIFIGYDDELVKKSVNFEGKKVFYGLKNCQILKTDDKGSEFVYKNKKFRLNVPGEYNIINSLAAIETAIKAGIEYELIAKGLEQYTPIDNRCDIFTTKNGAIIINDSYNANPESMKAAIDMTLSSYQGKKITLVLGDMAELGNYEEKYHKEIGNFLYGKELKTLITVGERARLIAKNTKNTNLEINSFNNNDEAVKYLVENINDETVVLLKASRCMSFDEIADELRK